QMLYCAALGVDELELFGEAESGGLRLVHREADASAIADATGLVLPSERRSGRVAPELVDYFRTQLQGHCQADMMLGPRDLIGTVSAQCQLIGRLLGSADGPTRQRLAEVGTTYGGFVAWLYLDAGDIESASRWHGAALELALLRRGIRGKIGTHDPNATRE
ncbi:MAG: hypothetical protein JWN00_1337, partial [Actinomycetia bacterium]|nr:hypothetical protein [Actinomycetes bacterium]